MTKDEAMNIAWQELNKPYVNSNDIFATMDRFKSILSNLYEAGHGNGVADALIAHSERGE